MDSEREQKLAGIAQLKSQAEKEYDEMYDLHNQGEINWRYELAYDSLREAAKIARELGLEAEAAAAESRAEHIRKVYRHQFIQPPDLLA